jgi:hypothetical protein
VTHRNCLNPFGTGKGLKVLASIARDAPELS